MRDHNDPNGSEIFSTGLRYFYEDAAGFAEFDPEHFEYTINAIRGIVP